MKEIKSLSDTFGLQILSITGGLVDDQEITIRFTDGNEIKMYHEQSCCEIVSIYEIDNDIQLMAGGIINSFYATYKDATHGDDIEIENGESGTWAFYNLNTSNGSVNIRWLGTSNGYYSEGVDIINCSDLSTVNQ